jgi:hypothetical protein
MNGPKASCGHEIELYWIKDEVWQQIPGARGAPEGSMTQCLDCGQKLLGRPFTLTDLAIGSYRRMKNMPHKFQREYARGTLCGACLGAGYPLPEGWNLPTERPHSDGIGIGRKLAEQTPHANSVIPSLIAEWRSAFGG